MYFSMYLRSFHLQMVDLSWRLKLQKWLNLSGAHLEFQFRNVYTSHVHLVANVWTLAWFLYNSYVEKDHSSDGKDKDSSSDDLSFLNWPLQKVFWEIKNLRV